MCEARPNSRAFGCLGSHVLGFASFVFACWGMSASAGAPAALHYGGMALPHDEYLIRPDPLDLRLRNASKVSTKPARRSNLGHCRARADDLPQFPGNRHRHDHQRSSRISGGGLPA